MTAAPVAAKCDPYKDYACLDSYLGTRVGERMSNYYSLEYGQATAPADPKAPPSRRDDVAPGAQTIRRCRLANGHMAAHRRWALLFRMRPTAR